MSSLVARPMVEYRTKKEKTLLSLNRMCGQFIYGHWKWSLRFSYINFYTCHWIKSSFIILVLQMGPTLVISHLNCCIIVAYRRTCARRRLMANNSATQQQANPLPSTANAISDNRIRQGIRQNASTIIVVVSVSSGNTHSSSTTASSSDPHAE